MEPTANRRAVHRDAMTQRQFQAQFVQGRIAPLRQACAHPVPQSVKLAGSAQIALPFRQKGACFPAQFDHVIDEFRRNPEMSGRFSMTMPFLNKSDDTLT